MDFTKCIATSTPHDFVVHVQRLHQYVGDVDCVAVERDLGAFVERFRQQNVSRLEMGGLITGFSR